MHGMIFDELRKYAETRYGAAAWDTLRNKAGVGAKQYSTLQEYPDSEAVALVSAAAAVTGLSAAAVLEDFGEFLAPTLLALYSNMILPQWKTIDIIDSTESTIHAIVRQRNKHARPPQLKTQRVGPDEVILTYDSARQMCALAKGIVKGMARHFQETIFIQEKECMHRGAKACVISFRKLAGSIH